ncbi:MAG: peptidylprolyl isomerase [Pseudomonadota bacterium]
MSTLYRLMRQPLLHFLVLGACIFAIYDLVSPYASVGGGEPDSEILVTRLQVDRMKTEFEAIWQRPPTPDEQQALVDNFIREEVLVREAMKLGLDQDDAVLRRRLVQKMEFLAASAARSRTPAEAELETFFLENQKKYVQPGRISFEQIYLGEAADEAQVEEIQTALRDGAPAEDLGNRTLLPFSLGWSAPAKVDGLFGEGVFDSLIALEGKDWQGPLKSGYGYHLVRILDRQAPRHLTFDEARKFVSEDWSLQQYNQLKAQQLEELGSAYTIIREEGVE